MREQLNGHNYVTVTEPAHRAGHRYYGCRIGHCDSCIRWRANPGLWHYQWFYPIHCYMCNAEMLLDEARDELQEELRDLSLGDANYSPGFQIVQDIYVFCTDCHETYQRRHEAMYHIGR